MLASAFLLQPTYVKTLRMACIIEGEDFFFFFLTADEGTITGEGGISEAPPESGEPDTKFQRTIGRPESQLI